MQQAKFLPTLRSLLAEANTPLIHRDLSWMQFNDRVLDESIHQSNPLLERAKFLSITYTNLDEFFMIRLSSVNRSIAQLLKQQEIEKNRRLSKIRVSLLETVTRFGAKQHESLEMLTEELALQGIRIVTNEHRDEAEFKIAQKIFEEQIFPKLEPPEPFSPVVAGHLESLQMAVVFSQNLWVRIPKTLPNSYLHYNEETKEFYIFFLDELLLMHIHECFRLTGPAGIVRVTRDGDFTVDLEEEDTESIPDIVRSGLKVRDRGKPMRMQYRGDFKVGQLDQIMTSMRLKQVEMFESPIPLSLNGLWSAVNQLPEEVKNRPGLSYPPLLPFVPEQFKDTETIFERLKRNDYIWHHPYDSFDAYVEWIRCACEDDKVTSIQQTIYRMDTLSRVVELLKGVAHRKRVRVFIELRARFDELNNLRLADELRKAGVEVAFGFGALKLHAKIALVTREEEGQEVLYTHLSTGNYNATTSRSYTDMAIVTSNNDIGQDARSFFDQAYLGKIPSSFKKLASAPTRLHKIITNLIDVEIEAAKRKEPARIVAKVNALVDEAVIEKLYSASQAGVKVDLIVRGACSLIPGVKGLSENIRVVSVVDRFLEHSRIYYFQHAKIMYLSSADWMPRNFFSRLELAFPVLDPKIYSYIEQVIIPAYLNDTVKGRELTPQGTWKKRITRKKQAKVRSQFYFEELAKSAYKGTPLDEKKTLSKISETVQLIRNVDSRHKIDTNG